MPLDPNIALSGVAPKINTPFENLNQVLNIRNQQLAGQERQARVRELERQAANEQKIQAIWTEHSDDAQTALKLTRQIDPKYAYEIEKGVGDAKRAWAEQIKSNAEARTAQLDTFLRGFSAIGEGDDARYQATRAQLVKEAPDIAGSLGPSLPAQLLTREDYEQVQLALHQGESQKDHLAHQRDSVEKIQKGDWGGIAELFSTASSPEEMAAMKSDLRAQFVPQRLLDLFKSPEQAKQVALGAKGRADIASKEATLAQTERHQKVLEGQGQARVDIARNRAGQERRSAADVVVQTNDGPMLLNKETGQTRPIMDPSGKPLARADTAEMRNKAAGRALLGNTLNAIETLSKKVITKRGIAQRATAAGRSVESALGNDPDFRVYQDARKAAAGNLAIATQGARPSDADILLIWLPMIPDVFSDTDQSAAQKWGLIREFTGTPTTAPAGGGGTGGGTSPGGSLYDRYKAKKGRP